MEDRLKSEEELVGLLCNCVLVLSLRAAEQVDEEAIVEMASQAAEKHIKELDERFPNWKADFLKER